MIENRTMFYFAFSKYLWKTIESDSIFLNLINRIVLRIHWLYEIVILNHIPPFLPDLPEGALRQWGDQAWPVDVPRGGKHLHGVRNSRRGHGPLFWGIHCETGYYSRLGSQRCKVSPFFGYLYCNIGNWPQARNTRVHENFTQDLSFSFAVLMEHVCPHLGSCSTGDASVVRTTWPPAIGPSAGRKACCWTTPLTEVSHRDCCVM